MNMKLKKKNPHSNGADVYEDYTKLSNQTKGKRRKAKETEWGQPIYQFAFDFF